MIRRATTITLALGLASPALADPPPGYYNSITASDPATLQIQLGALLNAAVTNSYDAARQLLQVIDEDPNNLANVTLVYNGQSVLSTWDSGLTWNREHTWPVSLGVGDSGSDYSDLHQLHPCNPSVNSSRGNRQFGTLPGQWDPNQFGKVYRGRMARVAFYMKTRYTYLNTALLGSQAQFIDWHIAEMPGDIENIRNDRVHAVQQNRNAFADKPELAWALFGTGPSDAQITLAGGASMDGSSSQSVDLGLRIGLPQDFPSVSLDLSKTGSAPTTYSITTAGAAEEVSRYQFGAARNAQSLSHTVTLTGPAFGPFEGTVTVDTTEITTAGVGLGAQDGLDTLTITGVALDHALASFDDLAQVTQLTLDFGALDINEDAEPIAFEIRNIAPGPFAASLDLDAVSLAGDAALFTTDLTTTPGIEPGAAAVFMADALTHTPGDYESVVTIELSDEDLPGAAGPVTLTLTLRATVGTPCLADANGDGSLSPADFSAWIAAFNTQAPACDQNGDSACTPADFSAWIANFNAGC